MHLIARAVLASVGVAALLAVAAPSAASGAIRITRIYNDSPGSDTRSNASRNAEWIRLKKTGLRTRQLRNWRVADTSGHVYYFDRLRLRPGRRVTLHTGDGYDTSRHRYWGSGNYVWNNPGDTARLRSSSGRLVDRCSYDGGGSSVFC